MLWQIKKEKEENKKRNKMKNKRKSNKEFECIFYMCVYKLVKT